MLKIKYHVVIKLTLIKNDFTRLKPRRNARINIKLYTYTEKPPISNSVSLGDHFI